ncbi:Translin [Naematelia encephala]|uniref:Translin n=1 Tax=Naematelia encephala TaxID=71784 RepID=A0A1Y2BBB3_9TREE|nr:Translin [Naematelia encephala]
MTDSSDRIKSVDDALTSVIGLLETESTLKKTIRESLEPIDDLHRSALAELNKLHSSSYTSHAAICSRTLEIISTAGPHWNNVASLVPEGEYYRYQFALGPPMRNLTTLVALAHFLLHDSLISSTDTAIAMGLPTTLQLTAEDYLQGVIGMVNELPRLSINSVTAQNFTLPTKIASFVNDIFASYSLLNLRNDALRRKFDSLKYDLKRCEDVVYDLTLRGLTRPAV